jgi:hypothetical protein
MEHIVNRSQRLFNFLSRCATNTAVPAMLAALVWGTLTLRLYLAAESAQQHGGNSLYAALASFQNFTIITTLLVALVLTASTTHRLGHLLRGSSMHALTAISITLVALVYHFMLSDLWQPQGLWRVVDLLLHYVIPGSFLLYWWLLAPKVGLRISHPLWWLAYPLTYVVMTLTRGQVTGHYPYPFFDVTQLGMGGVLLRVGALLTLFMVLSGIFLALGCWKGGHGARANG